MQHTTTVADLWLCFMDVHFAGIPVQPHILQNMTCIVHHDKFPLRPHFVSQPPLPTKTIATLTSPRCLQVSNSQIAKLARLAAGRKEASTSNGTGNGAAAAPEGPLLGMDEFRNTADKAYDAVDVPDGVIDILTSVRNFLQVSALYIGVVASIGQNEHSVRISCIKLVC